ncbi:MAG: ABC-2 transporter permease [Phycisphaerae bacterium]
MKALLWKDYRLNRWVLLFGGAVVAGVYGVGVVREIVASWPGLPSAAGWGGMLASYGTVLLYLYICLSGVLGGHAIAVERGDHSAHFLASLPPGKRQILASKFLIAAIAAGVMWGWIFVSLDVVAPRLNPEVAESAGGAARCAAAVSVLTFGVGWLASSCMEKTIFPILAALCSPVAVSVGLMLLAMMVGVSNVEISRWSNAACVVLGSACFVAGTWWYTRRVEP